jgi:polyisoprenoid-binding protein YceI
MSTRLKVLVGAAVAGVVLAGAGVWWYLRDDAPAPVSLDAAIESVDRSDSEMTDPDADPASEEVAASEGIEGTWTVDTETGDFDYERASGTFVGFRVRESLASVGETEAVGRTGDVDGSITIEGTTLTAAGFTVDMASITTNESRRDRRVHEALDTTGFPTATFVLTQPVDLGSPATAGEAVSVVATGELTVRGVTNPIEVPIEAQVVDGTVVVVGSVGLTFSDYGVEVPTAPIVLSADDHGVLELQLLLRRA